MDGAIEASIFNLIFIYLFCFLYDIIIILENLWYVTFISYIKKYYYLYIYILSVYSIIFNVWSL